MSAKEIQKKKVNIDGKEYDLESLSDQAKNMVGFIQRLDQEAAEMKFQLDKAGLAKKQAIIDLKQEVDKAD
jgi:cell division protein ZapA (FtsZ GTPase activity inhibitor)